MRLAEERGQNGHDKNDQQPHVVRHQRGQKREQGERLLPDLKQGAEERHATHRLAASSLKAVVEIRVLEVLEVEGGCVTHETNAHLVGEQVAEEALEEAGRSAHRLEHERQRELERDQREQASPIGIGGSDVGYDAVDDELGDPQHRQWPERAHDSEHQNTRSVGRLGAPDHREEARNEPERLHALPEGRQFPTAAVDGLGEGEGHAEGLVRAHREVPGTERPVRRTMARTLRDTVTRTPERRIETVAHQRLRRSNRLRPRPAGRLRALA